MAKKMKLPVASNKAVPVKIVNDYPETSAKDNDRDREYKAKYALEDIERAEGHKRDKALMNDVKKLAKEKVKSLTKVCGQ
jgi:hypothetical protein